MNPVLASTTTGGGQTLTLLHGFTNTSETWGPFVDLLAPAYGIQRVDLPGHGRSSGVVANLPESATLIEELLTEPTIVVGYSLGGRVALHVGLDQPPLLRGLVLIGATAGIENNDERLTRRTSDEALAARLRSSGDLGQFLEEWLDGPLFTSLTREQQYLEARLNNTVEGLASSLEQCGTGTQEPLWLRLADLEVPTLVLAGTRDAKFTELGQKMAAAIPAAKFQAIEGAGHAVHLERPKETAEAILRFATAIFA